MTAPVAPAISRQIAGTADRSSALWDFAFIVIASEPFGLPPHPSRLRRTAFPSEGKAFFGALNPVRQGTVLCLPSDTKPSPVCRLFHRTAQSEREKRNPVFQFMELKNTISLLSSLFTQITVPILPVPAGVRPGVRWRRENRPASVCRSRNRGSGRCGRGGRPRPRAGARGGR